MTTVKKISILAMAMAIIFSFNLNSVSATEEKHSPQCSEPSCGIIDTSKFKVLGETIVNFGEDYVTAKNESEIHDTIKGSGPLEKGDTVTGKLNVYTYQDGSERQSFTKAEHQAEVDGLSKGDIIKINFSDKALSSIDRDLEYSSGFLKHELSINLKSEKIKRSNTSEVGANLIREIGASNWQGSWKTEDGNGMGSYSGLSLDRSIIAEAEGDKSSIKASDDYEIKVAAQSIAHDSTVSMEADILGHTEINCPDAIDYTDRQQVDVETSAYQDGKNGTFETNFRLERNNDNQ